MELSKSNKAYLRNKFFNALPGITDSHPHIAELFKQAETKVAEIEVISQCFAKSGAAWVLDLAKPCFKEAKIRYTCYSNMGAYALG